MNMPVLDLLDLVKELGELGKQKEFRMAIKIAGRNRKVIL